MNDYEKIDISMIDYHVERKTVRGTQTAEQIRLSDGLKNLFPTYVNSLKLKNAQGVPMTLDNNGNGSFKAQIESMLAQSAQKALDEGKDLSGQTWLTIENGKVKAADFSAYAKFVGRQKTAPAFDGVDLSTGENNLFGDAQTQAKHFTAFGAQNSTVQGAQTADAATVRIMNAMNFIQRGGTQHYRIRAQTAGTRQKRGLRPALGRGTQRRLRFGRAVCMDERRERTEIMKQRPPVCR